VKTQVLLNVWDLFKEHGIEIPFPQRDLHLRTVAPDAGKALAGLETAPTDDGPDIVDDTPPPDTSGDEPSSEELARED